AVLGMTMARLVVFDAPEMLRAARLLFAEMVGYSTAASSSTLADITAALMTGDDGGCANDASIVHDDATTCAPLLPVPLDDDDDQERAAKPARANANVAEAAALSNPAVKVHANDVHHERFWGSGGEARPRERSDASSSVRLARELTTPAANDLRS